MNKVTKQVFKIHQIKTSGAFKKAALVTDSESKNW